MDFKQLEAFINVARQGSFSKAAQAMGISQPTVSTHIAALESELGCELLTRTSKAVYPNEKGQALLSRARELIQVRDAIVQELSQTGESPSGSLVIAASTVPSEYFLPGLLAAFHERYPRISYKLRSTNSVQVAEEVRKCSADVGLTGAVTEDGGCMFKPFAMDELAVITANTERFRELPCFTAALLAECPFIAREKGSGTRMETELLLRQGGIDPAQLNIIAEMSFTESIKKSVARGLGVAILSRHAVAEELKEGSLLAFGIEGCSLSRELYLVMRQNRPEVSLASIFFRFALGYFAGE